jgi:hypothetical protein
MKKTAYCKWMVLVAALISVCSPAVAADRHAVHSDTLHHPGGHATIPSHKQAYTLHSGIFDGRIGASYEPASVLRSGHTFPPPSGDVLMLEFNVQPSDPNGVPTYSDPSNQYSIDIGLGNYEHEDSGLSGRDWAVFRCHPNSNTGLFPVQVQHAFYRLSLDNNTPAIIRITGYGLDECPPGPAGGRNSSSSTLQTATGTNDGANDSEVFNPVNNGLYWRYSVDLRVGSCGSPVIAEGTNLAIGVQNFCNFNSGTSLELDAFENAVNGFPGANIRYADNGHSFATGAGTVFRPFSTVAGAVAAVPAGGIVSIVQASYNESMTISTAMTIVAPVGNVTIGPGPSPAPKIAEDDSGPAEEDRDNMAAPAEYNLSQNYPNPFNPQTTIEYALPKPGFVKLQIFDMLGQEVRTLVNEFQQPGFKSAIWDGRNNQGQLAPSGVYLYKIVTDGFTQSSKSILLK